MSGMEFYSEKKVTARKQHVCELCGLPIHPGEPYYRETGKFYGDFFSRALHVHCHWMEVEYCHNVDSEFTWDAIADYIQDIECRACEHSASYDTEPGWTECPCGHVYDCEGIKAKYGEVAS